MIKRINWEGPVFVISALEREGTEELSHAIMRYLDERALRLAEDPAFVEARAGLISVLKTKRGRACRRWMTSVRELTAERGQEC